MPLLKLSMVTKNKNPSNSAVMEEGDWAPPSSQNLLSACDPMIAVGLEIECESSHEEVIDVLSFLIMGYTKLGTFGLKSWLVNSSKRDYVESGDLISPSQPTSIEFIDFSPDQNKTSGFVAIGFIGSELCILKLNEYDCLESFLELGSTQSDTIRHSGAVLDLSWNPNQVNMLASGSADNTVIVWDMNTCSAATRLECFSEKVQSVKWHPIEAQSLLTGCCDRAVKLFDCRTPGTNKSWAFEGEIERIMWNKFDPIHFFASTDKGIVHYVDIRATKPIWNVNAHTSAVGGLALSSYCKDMLVTGSQDETAKVWDLKDSSPSLVSEKQLQIGHIYAISACPDSPYVFAAGGANPDNPCIVFDTRDPTNVVQPFCDRLIEPVDTTKVVGTTISLPHEEETSQ